MDALGQRAATLAHHSEASTAMIGEATTAKRVMWRTETSEQYARKRIQRGSTNRFFRASDVTEARPANNRIM